MPNVISVIVEDILLRSSQAPARSSVQLEVNGLPLTMGVDTATSTSLIGEPVYLSHFKHLPLVSTTPLRGCTGHIHLDWNALFPINYVKRVQGDVKGLLRNNYPPVFKEVPGDIKSVEVNVVLKERAIPVLYDPRIITIPLRNAAKKAAYLGNTSGATNLHGILQHKVDAFILAYRNTLHTFTKVTPTEVFPGRKPHIKLSLIHRSMVLKQRVKEAQAKFATSQSSKVTYFSPADLLWVHSVTHRKLKAVPGETQDRPSTDPTPEALHRAPSEMAMAHTPVRPSTASPGVSDLPISLVKLNSLGRPSNNLLWASGLKRVAWPPPLEDQEIVESQPIYSKGPAFSDQFGPAPIQAAQPSYPAHSAPSAQPPQSYKPSKVASPPLLAYQPPPATITLRAEPPIHQEQAPVFTSQPAATKGLGSNMRGDEKWPPATVKAQSAAENEARKALAKGPAFRPRKVKKDYSNFFAQNALNPNYPGYRAPPGTQHYTEEGTSDL
uniref:Uncharacterized protein n=1 Tax=Timema cristinae TaxID=61476 RepID=A0A7R9DEL3_TIMCR|nr:unnamed protein product [Timema cristinae]